MNAATESPKPIVGPEPLKDLPAIFTRAEQRARAVELFESADVIQELAIKVNPIGDEVQASKAAELRAQANQLAKDLDAERLETTSGLRSLVDWWNATFNARTLVVQGLVRSLDKALQSYMAEKARKQREEREALERAQREEQARREAEAETLGVEPPPPPPPVVVPPSQAPYKITGSHGASLAMRDNWKWRVTNIKKVADNLLVPPEDRIQKPVMNSLAKTKAKEYLASLPPDAEKPAVIKDVIPGIEIYNEPVNASRVL